MKNIKINFASMNKLQKLFKVSVRSDFISYATDFNKSSEGGGSVKSC